MLIVDPTECSAENFRWFIDGPRWPVSDQLLSGWAQSFFDVYWDLASQCPEDEADLLIADAPAVVALLNLIQNNYAINWAEQNAHEYLGSSSQYFLRNLLDVEGTFGLRQSRTKLITGVARTFYTTAKQAYSLGAYPKLRPTQGCSFSLGFPKSYLREEFFRREKIFSIWCDDYVMSFRNQVSLDNQINQRIKDVVVELLTQFFSISNKGVKGLPKDKIIQAWIGRLSATKTLFDRAYASYWIRGGAKNNLHLFGPGNIYRKVFGIASQRAGINVYNYIEKNTFLNIEPFGHSYEEKIWNNVYCVNESVAIARRKNYRKVAASRHHKEPKYYPVFSSHYQELADQATANTKDDFTHDVIIVGFPLVHFRYLDDPSLFFYFRLGFEIRLVEQLQGLGHRVAYSIHPERILAGHVSILRKLGVNIITEPFESGHRFARTILFTHFSTSVLGAAVASGKPIVAFVKESAALNPEAAEALFRRVATIKYTINPQGRAEYSTARLEECMGIAEQKKLNTTFLDYYL